MPTAGRALALRRTPVRRLAGLAALVVAVSARCSRPTAGRSAPCSPAPRWRHNPAVPSAASGARGIEVERAKGWWRECVVAQFPRPPSRPFVRDDWAPSGAARRSRIERGQAEAEHSAQRPAVGREHCAQGGGDEFAQSRKPAAPDGAAREARQLFRCLARSYRSHARAFRTCASWPGRRSIALCAT